MSINDSKKLKVTIKSGTNGGDFEVPYTVESSPLTDVFTFTAEGDFWNICSDKAYVAAKGKFAVEGFRKGKVPRAIIESNYGKDVFLMDTEEIAINECYQALMESGIIDKERLAMRPQVEVSALENGKAVFSLTMAYEPKDVEIVYTGLDIQKAMPDVDGAVEREVSAARERAGYWEEVTRPVVNGDQTNIDYCGKVDGVAFDGGTAEKQELVIGSNTFIPGFEEQLIGMSVGEEKDINVTFPKEYGAENLAGKDAVFTIKLHSIKSKILPELDDDFAKDVSEFDTLEAYKADIRAKAEDRENKNAEIATSNRIIEALLAKNTFELSPVLLESKAAEMFEEMRGSMEKQGIPFERYMEYIGKTQADMMEGYKSEAASKERTRFIMNTIVEKENLRVTQADYEVALEVRAKSAGKSVSDYRRYVKQDEAEYILNSLMTDKIIKFLSDNNNLQ